MKITMHAPRNSPLVTIITLDCNHFEHFPVKTCVQIKLFHCLINSTLEIVRTYFPVVAFVSTVSSALRFHLVTTGSAA